MSDRPPVWPQRWWWLVLSTATFLAVGIGLRPVFGWGPPQWSVLTASAREATLLAGVVVAAFSAFLPRPLTVRSVVAGPSAAAVPLVMRKHLVRIAAAVSAGSIAALVIASVYLAIRSDYGGPDVLAMAGTVVGLIAIGWLAYALSIWIPMRAGPLVSVLVATLAIVILPGLNAALVDTTKSTRQPSFVWFNSFPLLGWEVTTQTSAVRIVLFAVFAFACGAFALVRSTTSGGAAKVAIVTLATSIVMTVLAIAISPPLVVERPPPAECATESELGVEICLHPGYLTLRDQVTEATATALDPVPAELTPAVLQQTGTAQPQIDGEAVPLQLDVASSDADLIATVAVPISHAASGLNACYTFIQETTRETTETEEFIATFEVHSALALTLQERAGVEIHTGMVSEESGEELRSDELIALTQLNNQELKDWMSDNAEKIRSCSLTPADLP